MSAREPRSASDHRSQYGDQRTDSAVSPCAAAQTRSEPSAETLRVELSTEDDLMIPEASFRIRFANGETRSGQLGPDGIKTLQGVPAGSPFEIAYTDPADVRAKALAVRLNAGLAAKSFPMVAGILRESSTDLADVKARFERFFGPDMVAACCSAFNDENEGIAIRFLLTKAGLSADATVVPYCGG